MHAYRRCVRDADLAPLIQRCAGSLREVNVSCAGPLGDATLACLADHCAPNLRLLDVCYAPNVTPAGKQPNAMATRAPCMCAQACEITGTARCNAAP